MRTTALLMAAAVLLVSACSSATSTATAAPSPDVALTATAATTPTSSPLTTAAPTATIGQYANTTYKFSLVLPEPYRNSARLSYANSGGSPAAQAAFTARSDADEATVAGTRCETACPIWNYVAVVQIHTGVGSQTPRQFYTAFGGAVGEIIEDTTVDGRQAVRVTNGVPYQFQYLVKDGDRMFRIAEQIYPADMFAVPAGASRSKLDQILASFRFIP